MILHIRTAALALLLTALLAPALLAAPRAVADEDDATRVAIALSDARVASVRLEIFDAAGATVADSGLIDGRALTLDLVDADVDASSAPWRAELRAWDAQGDLVVSQLSSVAPARGLQLSRIDFDLLPAGLALGGGTISLESNTDVTGDLTVTGSVRTGNLQNSAGGSFFGSCPSGQAIRTIAPTGSVACETVGSGGGGGDNLGNHQATTTLNMGFNWIQSSGGFGIRSPQGAEVKTGPEGSTFMFRAGTRPDGDIGQFRTVSDQLALAVLDDGQLDFVAGAKLCIISFGSVSDAVMPSGGWTTATCSQYAAARGASSIRLGCLFRTSFSLGANGGGAPSPNCGW
ncbi:MAG: hypothetical protein AAF772_16895 [Acidobacteriota bacterium]